MGARHIGRDQRNFKPQGLRGRVGCHMAAREVAVPERMGGKGQGGGAGVQLAIGAGIVHKAQAQAEGPLPEIE